MAYSLRASFVSSAVYSASGPFSLVDSSNQGSIKGSFFVPWFLAFVSSGPWGLTVIYPGPPSAVPSSEMDADL